MIRHPDLSMRRPVHQSGLHFPHGRKDERTVRLALCIGPHLFFGHETRIVHRHSSHSFLLLGFFFGLSLDGFFFFPDFLFLESTVNFKGILQNWNGHQGSKEVKYGNRAKERPPESEKDSIRNSRAKTGWSQTEQFSPGIRTEPDQRNLEI